MLVTSTPLHDGYAASSWVLALRIYVQLEKIGSFGAPFHLSGYKEIAAAGGLPVIRALTLATIFKLLLLHSLYFKLGVLLIPSAFNLAYGVTVKLKTSSAMKRITLSANPVCPAKKNRGWISTNKKAQANAWAKPHEERHVGEGKSFGFTHNALVQLNQQDACIVVGTFNNSTNKIRNRSLAEGGVIADLALRHASTE